MTAAAFDAIGQPSSLGKRRRARATTRTGAARPECCMWSGTSAWWGASATECTNRKKSKANLLDEEGTVQAQIFYKAVQYDRRADITWRT